MSDPEAVCEALPRRNRALRYARDAILGNRVQLSDSMPVNGSPIVDQVICHVNSKSITPISLRVVF